MQKIALHSVPRSGSSWLGEIINSSPGVRYAYQPLFSYACKSALDENSSAARIELFYQDIAVTDDAFINQAKERDAGLKPIFRKSEICHVAYKEVRYHYILENLLCNGVGQRVLGLVRHPLAVLESWMRAPREFRCDLGWVFADEWRLAERKNEGKRENYFGYTKWKETALLFKALANRYPDRFLLVYYGNLLADAQGEVERIYKFLGLEFCDQTRAFLDQSRNIRVAGTYSVFRDHGPLDDKWEGSLPPEVVAEVINDCENSKLTEFIL